MCAADPCPPLARRLRPLPVPREQKVNEKNSWSLDLINHMGRDINEASGDGGEEITNFQRAAGTLEAGIKIYSYRVDSVYTETFKLMGGLNRSSKRDGQGEEEEDEEADATEDGAPKPKKEKVNKRVATAFLESNPANLCLKKLEMSFDVDPLFHQTSAKFDEGGAKGLLLHNLPVQHGCALVFDSSDAERPTAATPAPAPAPKLPLSCISNLVPHNFLELHISSEFSQRHEPAACDWAPAGDGSARSVPEHEASGQDEEDEGVEEGGAAEDEAASFDDDVPFDEPPDDDDDGFGDDGPVDGRDELLQQAQQGDDEGRMAILSVNEMAAEHEGDVAEGLGQSAEEAAHEKAQQMLRVGQRWAGPGHWKFHAAPKPREAGGGGGGGRGGGGKAPFVMDFSRRAEALKRINDMPLESKGTTLSEAALSKATEADNTLPVDCHYTVDNLSQLFHKPGVRVRRGRACVEGAEMLMGWTGARDGPKQAWTEAEAGGFETQADDGCGEETPDFGDDWADGSGQEPSTGAEPLGAADAAGAFDLVAQPTRVEKIEIGYAKVAKQVDISGLKTSLWDLLSDGSSSGDLATRHMDGAVSFQQVVARLPEKIPEQKLPDISIAYNFICLLHLANEKGLEITGQDDFADMHVSQPAKA